MHQAGELPPREERERLITGRPIHPGEAINDDLDSAAVPKCPTCGKSVDRRDHSAQVFYVRRLNRILVFVTLVLVVAVFSSIATTWNVWERQMDRTTNHRLNCRLVWLYGARDPMCIEYEAEFAALDRADGRVSTHVVQPPVVIEVKPGGEMK